jgi:glycosyltransferase involved in cell wall biosynthesis
MNVAVDLACKQSERGHDVAFASAGGSYVDLIGRYGVAHFHLEQPWRKPVALSHAYFRLCSILRQLQPDIVHAHMVTGAILARAARSGGRFRLITTVHNEWQRSAILMAVGDRVIAVSAAVGAQLERRGVPKRRIRVVRNGPIGSPRRRGESESAGPGRPRLDRPALVTVAGLYHRKGIGDLIAAFAMIAGQYPSASLYIVGDGPDRSAFEAQAGQTPFAGRIKFMGFFKDPHALLTQADIFILASRKDPMPLVIPEAREAGCAIIATHVDGIPEGLDNGQAGVLVPPRNPPALAEAMARLLDDPNEIDLWRRRAASNLDWLRLDRTVDETLHVYDDALGQAEAQRNRAVHF